MSDHTLEKQIWDSLLSASSVLIGTHLNPDGDALGSALGLMHVLKKRGIPCEVICNNLPPYNLLFLPGSEQVKLQAEQEHPVAVVLDLDNYERLGRSREAIEKCPLQIVIDHHVPHQKPGQLRLIDSDSSATALMLFELLQTVNEPLNPETAQCLLTGIVTDTGSFRYSNTTPSALHATAILIENGGDMVQVSEEVYGKRPLASIEMLGEVLSRMHLELEGRLAWASLPEESFLKHNATEVHTEGLASDLLTIESVKVAVVLRKPPGQLLRASLRSRDHFDVSKIARTFDGGGHEKAAGCTFHCSIEEAEIALIGEVRKCLES